MNIAALIVRLLLALVFVVAGSAKIVDRKGSRQVLGGFGFPTAIVSLLGILLPLAELTVAAALLLAATAWWGALGALALLLLFIAGIGLNLARGREFDCHCFGQLHSAPAGRKALARVTGRSPQSPASWSGKGGKAISARARLAGPEPSRRSN